MIDRSGTPLVELRDIRVAFGGVHAVRDVTVDLYPGEVVGLVGGNGAGKTTLIRTLSGAHPADSGQILIGGEPVTISHPRDAKALGVETIYQNLALADNIDAPGNVFLGRELTTRFGNLDDSAMEDATRKLMGRLNPKFQNFVVPVASLSGGQRQSVAIARAVHFNARILIMDEPTAALGPAETKQVGDLIKQLREEGLGIFLISHDIHDVYDLSDRITRDAPGQAGGHGREDRGHDRRGPGHDHPGQAARRGHAEGPGRPALTRTSRPPDQVVRLRVHQQPARAGRPAQHERAREGRGRPRPLRSRRPRR